MFIVRICMNMSSILISYLIVSLFCQQINWCRVMQNHHTCFSLFVEPLCHLFGFWWFGYVYGGVIELVNSTSPCLEYFTFLGRMDHFKGLIVQNPSHQWFVLWECSLIRQPMLCFYHGDNMCSKSSSIRLTYSSNLYLKHTSLFHAAVLYPVQNTHTHKKYVYYDNHNS